MLPAILLGLMGTLLLAAPASSDPIFVDARSVGSAEMPRFEVVSRTDEGVELLFELPALVVEEVPIEGSAFRSVEIPGGGLIGEAGHPALPVFTRFVAIPDRAAVRVEASVESSVEWSGFDLAPMPPDDGADIVRDETAYRVEGYPAIGSAEAGEPAIARDLRLVPLTIRPVRYDPAGRSLAVDERIRIRVSFEGEDPTNARRENARRSVPPSYDRLYRELVVNYEEPPRGMPIEMGGYLVICPDDAGVVSRLQPLLDWRKRQGYEVVLATTSQTGTTAEQIKSYIQNAYDTWDPAPEFVVLAGDATTPYRIRCFYETLSGYGGEGDHPYTQLEGGDVLADCHIGRLSFSSLTELETIVAKIVGYETAPYIEDPTWFNRACLVGDPYDSGYSTVIVQQWIKRRLLAMEYAEIDTIFNSPFVSRMTPALNRGDTIFSYRGIYGMSGWGNSNTYALSNGWKLPFVVAITCDTGSFASGTARSEGFLRAGSATQPKGGIGAIGSATIGTHTRYNNCMHYGIFYGLLYEGQSHLGAALTRGKLEMYLNYQATEPNKVAIWSHWHNLMGDPAVECWTGYPQPLTVIHPSEIPVGSNAVAVRVEEQDGSPAAGVHVCLFNESDNRSVATTDAAGEIELPISATQAGTLKITVTGRNRHPYLADIPVVGGQMFVGYLNSSVDDDGAGQSAGNGDGIVNPGEAIELAILLKNHGLLAAPEVEATLTTRDPYVAIETAERSYGDIPAGGTMWSQGSYLLSVDPGCPHGRTLVFGLDVRSGAQLWHARVELPVVSADLAAEGHSAYDVGGNNRFDPGETGRLSVRLKNLGGTAALSPTGVLLSMSQYVTIPDPNGSWSDIPAGGSAENAGDTFTLTIDPACYVGYEADLKLVLEFNDGARDTTHWSIPIGARTTSDPTGPCAYGYYAFDNTDVSYPEAPVYNWVEIDPAYGGNGTEVVLGDYGQYQDKSRVVDIPFPFTYYGREHTRATICSNGWLSMGATWTAEYRNWTIPGAGGPEAMIAPFWDNLYQVTGSKVLQKYDQANHRWIVQWSRMRNAYGGAIETFQAILYDPAHHPTETGDGIILFQYETVVNPDVIDGRATVGIENHDQSVGLLYTFFNIYEPGAATLQAGRAIRFVPKREVISGRIEGTVRNTLAGGIPVPGAAVAVLESENEYISGPDGRYLAVELPGSYTVVASHEGFEPDTVSGVGVLAGGSVQLDLGLRDTFPPSITTVQVATTNDTIGPYRVEARITDPTPLTEQTLRYRVNGGEFIPLAMMSIGGDRYRAEIPGQPWQTKVEYYVEAEDAAGNRASDPPDAPETLYVFYVAPTTLLFADDMESDKGWTVGGLDDDAVRGIWVRVDPNGTYDGEEMIQPEDDHTEDPGRFCWVTGNGPPGGHHALEDVDGGRTTLTSPRLFLTVEGVVILRYYRWYTNDTGAAGGEDVWRVQASDDDGATWVDLESTTESDRSWRMMEFDLGSYISFTDQVRIRFIAEDIGEASIVEAAVDDLEILFTGLHLVDVAEIEAFPFRLEQNRPNPFNPRTTIRFSLPAEGQARLVVYDVQGRSLRLLIDGRLPAGAQTVEWDGRDDHGKQVRSGIYFYRLDAAGREQTRKMVLLE